MTKNTLAAFLLLAFCSATNTTAATSPAWLAQIGGKGAEVVAAVTEASDQRICAAGTYWVNTDFGRGSDLVTLTSTSAQDIFLACYHLDGSLAFARNFGAARSDRPRALAAMPGGDVVMTGQVAGGFHAEDMPAGHQSADLFVNRIDAQGREVWSRVLGGKLSESGNALAVTKDGGILVAGAFADVLPYAVGDKLPKLISAGARDAMVIKFDANGDIVWATRLGGAGDDEATAVSTRADGSVLVAGTFRDDLTFAGKDITSHGYRDVFVASLDAAGRPQWLQHLGGPQQETVHGLVHDALGRTHIAGNFQSTIDVAGHATLASAGGTDVYVARFDADGNVQHASSFGGALTDQVFALALTRDSGLLLSGHFQGEADLAPGPAVATMRAASASNSSGFLVRLKSNGDYLSATQLGGAGMEMALGLSALDDGGVAVVGLFNEDLTIAPLPALDNRGKTDVFVLRLPHQGARQLSRGRSPDTVKLGW